MKERLCLEVKSLGCTVVIGSVASALLVGIASHGWEQVMDLHLKERRKRNRCKTQRLRERDKIYLLIYFFFNFVFWFILKEIIKWNRYKHKHRNTSIEWEGAFS